MAKNIPIQLLPIGTNIIEETIKRGKTKSDFVSGGGGGSSFPSPQPAPTPLQTTISQDIQTSQENIERFEELSQRNRGRQQAFKRLRTGGELTQVDLFNIGKVFKDFKGDRTGRVYTPESVEDVETLLKTIPEETRFQIPEIQKEIPTDNLFVNLGTPFPERRIPKDTPLLKVADISFQEARKEQERAIILLNEYRKAPKIKVGINEILKYENKIQQTGENIFAIVDSKGNQQFLQPKTIFAFRTLKRITGGQPSLTSLFIEGIDLAVEKFDKKIVRERFSGIPILGKRFGFSVGELAVSSAFGKLISQGASAKGVQVAKKKEVVKDIKKLKDALKKLSDEDLELFRKVQKNNILKNKALSDDEIKKRLLNLNTLVLEIKTKTPLFTESGAIDFKNLQRALSKVAPRTAREINKLSFDVFLPRVSDLKGAGAIAGTIGQIGRINKIPKPFQKPIRSNISSPSKIQDKPQIRRSLFEGTGLYERINEVSALSPFELQKQVLREQNQQLEKRLLNLNLNQFQINKLKTLQRQGLLQALSQSQIQKSLQKQLQIFRQQQGQTQLQRQGLGLATSTLQLQRQQQRQQQRFRQRFTTRPRERFRPRPKLRLPLFPLLPELEGRRKVGKKIPFGITGKTYDVFTRKFGKIRRINPKPLTKSKALDYGAYNTARTLRASFIIRPSQRKGTGKIPLGVTGSFKKLQSQFRPSKSKSLKGFFIEKRKYRLDSPLERKEIKSFKRRK